MWTVVECPQTCQPCQPSRPCRPCRVEYFSCVSYVWFGRGADENWFFVSCLTVATGPGPCRARPQHSCRLLGFLFVLPPFAMPPLTYGKMVGPEYAVSQPRSKNKPENPNNYTQNHPRTYTNPISILKRDGRRRSRRPSILRAHI